MNRLNNSRFDTATVRITELDKRADKIIENVFQKENEMENMKEFKSHGGIERQGLIYV